MAHRRSAMQYSKLSAHIISVLLASHKLGIKRNSENELNMFQILLLCVGFCLNAVWYLVRVIRRKKGWLSPAECVR